MGDNRSKNLQAALRQRIAEIEDAQLGRAEAVETALKVYEQNIRIRSVSDYIALSNHQRNIMGTISLNDTDDTDDFGIVEQVAAKRLKVINGKK